MNRRHGLHHCLPRCAVLFVAMAACTALPPERSLVLQVSNELDRSIVEIHKKQCDDLDLAFSPIEDSRLAPGERRGFILPRSCVDLVAYDARGRIVGEQRGLRMLPDASWVLRR